ncbi:SDR family oxidoreductase [Quadrisphaera oryzae]|uniref:SDR family oxidoreductase n=1 Tax=Quadrisphaera TaxID=317661 RepID=UPI0016470B54|nr:SDR family oxidoreductase [Quadrisphaera sp. RL12-1S]MBC3760781.1 SDR family oxidoreductase [Quadrisphaera sp. RL12-1S]
MTSHPLFDISGTTALVTGSSRGIGLALAHGLLEAGCTVVLNARDPQRLEAAREQLETSEAGRRAADAGGRVLAVPFDGTDAGAVREGVARVEEEAGPIGVLVNNTGMQHRQPLLEFPDEKWHQLLATNLTSAFFVGREVARRMAPRGRGKIINIASLQSEVTRPGITPYAATKGGLKMLTKGMCADLAPSGICVNAIGPGYFDTELTQALVADEQFSAWVRGRTPAGRWGDVRDLVGALLFLASPASDFVNGQVVYVDGGMTCVL